MYVYRHLLLGLLEIFPVKSVEPLLISVVTQTGQLTHTHTHTHTPFSVLSVA